MPVALNLQTGAKTGNKVSSSETDLPIDRISV
jgi:hypothetical protein